MKTRKKEVFTYAVSAFLFAFPLQLFVDWVSGHVIRETPVWVYVVGALIFSALSMLFNFLFAKRK